MKNLLLTTFLFQLLLCFFSCENRNVESEKIIYSEELIAHVGDFKMGIPDGCNFAYDEIQGKIWFHRGLYHSSEFFLVSSSGMIEKSFVIDYEDGSPVTGGGGPGFFVSDNIALVCEGSFKKPHFFLVDLEKQSYRLAKVDADYVLLSDFYDNKLFVTVLDGGLGFYDFMTEEFNNVETDLHGYGFMKKANSFVGMNKRGNVVIQKFGTDDKKELKIRGLKTDNGNGFIRDRYYLTDKYLYFSKRDVGYSTKYFIPLLIGSLTCLGTPQTPHVWYRYSLDNGDVRKIKTENPFIKILGVIEEN